MTKVCLIDGSGYIFRAFYALPNMTAPNGTPVNAVYGFVTMFMRLLKNIDCDYCVVLFDAKRQNYRNEIFADYTIEGVHLTDAGYRVVSAEIKAALETVLADQVK